MNRFFLLAFAIISFSDSFAQRDLTEADYKRAERWMGYNTTQMVDRLSVQPNYLSGNRFWYRVLTTQGSEFIMVDASKGTRSQAFDQQRAAKALSKTLGRNIEAYKLPFNTFTVSPDNKTLEFAVAGKRYKLSLDNYSLTTDQAAVTPTNASRRQSNVSVSPDGKREVFIRDWNLWLRDKATGKETQLTTDGVKDFGYATDNAGWIKSDRPIVVWSPDSRKIATYQQDQRHVSDMYLVTTNVGAPKLEAWKYPLPTDSQVIMIHRVIIELDQPKIIRMKLAPGPRRSTLCDDISCAGKDFGDNQWSEDGTQLAFVTTSRDHKNHSFFIADAATGDVREVFQENVATQYESGQDAFNWRYLPATKEIIWFSERDDWGHLYLYDAITGKLKHQITKGSWAVQQLLKVDEKNRVLYFNANGREAGRNPYYSHFYKINFDGSNLTLLTPENGFHSVRLLPSENYFIDSYSEPNVPPVIVLRDMNGKLITTLEKADITRLKSAGWKPPTPITVKARDGKTDLYGLMFTPTNLDPKKKYPVVNYIYPGPQGGSVGSWSFLPARGDHQALAELGFVVVLIEGTCNPGRSKSFHDMCYGNMADNTLPDQISGIKQLAAKHPYMDINKVGIWGHSGGGFATAAAMFRYPDFYKVGIAESGNHDNRNYEDDWGERYIGLLKKTPDGKDNYEAQANQIYAKNLKGKLLLAHGMMDDNVPPYNTLLVVDALQKANKDFDLIMFPHARHGYGEMSLYMTRRRWDYFVKHLMGVNHPKEYELRSSQDRRSVL